MDECGFGRWRAGWRCTPPPSPPPAHTTRPARARARHGWHAALRCAVPEAMCSAIQIVASAGLGANSLSRRRHPAGRLVTLAMAPLLLYCALLLALAATPSLGSSSTVNFTQPGAPFRRGFNGCVGSGHALLGLRSDWRTHLAAVRSDLGVQYIRFHGILDDDMSVVRDDSRGYSFFNTDSVLDYILSLGILPVVELSFMPRALAARPNETIFHYNGITSPPADWQQFADLIVAFVSHHVARYGLAAVQTWYYEVGH
jgi:hypothetical protein